MAFPLEMKPTELQKIRVIDSHTEGEPTRVIVSGLDEPRGASMSEKREDFAKNLDWVRSAVVCEPRGHEAMVGVMLCKPVEADCVTGLIFFNNVGVLNGCLHATMGVALTLMHQGQIGGGMHRFDTPTGVVSVDVSDDGAVTVENVRSYRDQVEMKLTVPNYGEVTGDVAWGGNWFYLTDAPAGMNLDSGNIEELTNFAWKIRLQLEEEGIKGTDGAEIDHVELFGAPSNDSADAKNFVLCPGKAYDRSPCGTGTSAKLACLHAAGKLKEREVWRQAGILDTVFTGEIREVAEGGVIPIVRGRTFITGEAELFLDPRDPFMLGI